MNKKTIITVLLALAAMAGQAQEVRIDTVIPKFLSNGYFFREMPTLPDGEKTMSRLKDKEGNSVIVINVDATVTHPQGYPSRTSSQRRSVPERTEHDGHGDLADTSGRQGRRHMVFAKGGRAVPTVLGDGHGRTNMDERKREGARHGD